MKLVCDKISLAAIVAEVNVEKSMRAVFANQAKAQDPIVLSDVKREWLVLCVKVVCSTFLFRKVCVCHDHFCMCLGSFVLSRFNFLQY